MKTRRKSVTLEHKDASDFFMWADLQVDVDPLKLRDVAHDLFREVKELRDAIWLANSMVCRDATAENGLPIGGQITGAIRPYLERLSDEWEIF